MVVNGDQRGFSLIELLIVIVIIAILMGILLPSFKQFDFWVKDGACQRNLKDMYQVLTGYASRYEGWFPAPVDGYYGQKFTSYDVGNLSQWSDERDPFSVLPHIQALLQLGGSADMFFCPFNSDYGQWDQWPMNSWEDPFYADWANSYYVYTGYTMLFGRDWVRFRDGRVPASRIDDDVDIPIVADNLHCRENMRFISGWTHGGGVDVHANHYEGLFTSSCNTLFNGGQVTHTEWEEFEEGEPAMTIGSCHDMYWFDLEP